MNKSHQDLTNEDIDKVFSSIDVPTCPALVLEVMAEAQKDDPDIQKLVKSISSDVGMSAVALKIVNSPLFRSGTPITNIRLALERLGMRNILCVVIAAALRSSMSSIAPNFIEKFWDRTSYLATASGLIAKKQYGISPDAAYTYALFHDIGIPLMAKRFPDYEEVVSMSKSSGKMLHETEATYYPCTHPVIGYLMTKSWGLPAIIGQAIRFHHDPEVYELPDSVLPGAAISLIAITQIAEHIQGELSSEIDIEVGHELFLKAVQHFGISADDLADYKENIMAAAK